MALQFIITNVGRAAVASAISAGTGPVRISTIKLGDASWTPDATASGALQSLKATIAAVGGTSVSTDSIHVTGTDATTAAYDVKEIGIYTDAGILFAIYSQATPILTKSAATVAVISVDLVISGVPASSVTVTSTNTFYDPPSSSTLAGVIRIATTAEAQSGTLDTAALTPKKLQDVSATETRNGVLRIATTAEALAGINDSAGITPKKLKDVVSAIPAIVASTETVSGIIKLATSTEAQVGSDDTKAITPKKLQDASATANTANRLVKRDASGNFSAGTITASLNGNASSANILAAARTISLSGDATGSISFDGSANVTLAVDVRAASTTQDGLVELATDAEVAAGTDATRAVTPASIAALQTVSKAWARWSRSAGVISSKKVSSVSVTTTGSSRPRVNLITGSVTSTSYTVLANAAIADGISGMQCFASSRTTSSFMLKGDYAATEDLLSFFDCVIFE